MPRARARLAVLVVLLGGVLLASAAMVGAACAPFGSAPDEGGPADGALVDGDGGILRDATLAEVGPSCKPPSCVDFENGVPTGWQAHGDGGGLAIMGGMATSGVNALDLTFSDKAAYFGISLAGKKKVTVTANVLVVELGTGEVDLFGIAESQDVGAPGILLVHRMSALNTLAVELPGGQAQYDLAADFSKYTPVTLTVDLDTGTYAYEAGSSKMSGTLTSPLSPTSVSVVIGGVYPAPGFKPWHVRYDDVTIVATP